MTPTGDLKYEVECLICGAYFYLDSMTVKLPNHPRADRDIHIPCAGSGRDGRMIGPHIVGGKESA